MYNCMACGRVIPDNSAQQALFEMSGMCEPCRIEAQKKDMAKDSVNALLESLAKIGKAIQDVNETLKLLKRSARS